MKRKYFVIALSFIITGSIVAGGAMYSKNKATSASNDNTLNVQTLSFDYVNQKSNLKDLVSSSELIVKGKVTKITPIEFKKVIFTDYDIDIQDVLKGENQHVVVRLTGGTLDGTKLVAEGIEQLEKNQEYMFCLQKVFPDDSSSNLFSPIGAYQGIFAIDESQKHTLSANEITTSGEVTLSDNDKIKIKSFNKNNVIEKELAGKEIDVKKFK